MVPTQNTEAKIEPTVMIQIGAAADGMRDRLYIDIETRKVPAPSYWPFHMRWQTFMVGVAYTEGNATYVEIYEGTEGELINRIAALAVGKTIVYSAGYRDFDKWVLTGRFTHARAALNDVPGDWPHLYVGVYEWLNIPKQPRMRLPDLLSKDVPATWAKGGESEKNLIRLHCLRDVIEVVLDDPKIEFSFIRDFLAQYLVSQGTCDVLMNQ